MAARSILKKVVVGDFGCNCYLAGSRTTNGVFVIDPGAEHETLIGMLDDLKLSPRAIILTHTHRDHTGAVRKLKRHYHIPLWYRKEGYRTFFRTKADRWLKEGDEFSADGIHFGVLETGGHSPCGISIYTKDIKTFRNKRYDGVIFTGDLIFRHTIGRTDVLKGDRALLLDNISRKIIYNAEFGEEFLLLGGHMGLTTIGEEKRENIYGKLFLKEEDWKKNKYYGSDFAKNLS